MSRYRKVEVATWTDERFRELSPAPPNAQTLWLYLLTGQRTTALPGLVIANELVMAADLGWPVEAFREVFQEVFAKGMAEASWKGGLVVLPKALFDSTGEPRETAKPQSPNVIKSWAKAWDEVPDCDLKNRYLKTLESFSKALGEAFSKAFAEAFRKALAKASRHPSGIQEQDTGAGTRTGRRAPRAPERAPGGDPDRDQLKSNIVSAIGPEHAKAFARVKQAIGSTALGPSMVDSFTELRDLLESLPSLADAEARCRHVLAVREAEAMSKRTVQYFGSLMWKRANFDKALALEIPDVDGSRPSAPARSGGGDGLEYLAQIANGERP